MLNIRLFDWSKDDMDDNRCDCGRNPYVILEANNVKIGLCDECVEEVAEHVQRIQNELKHICKHCVYFQRDKYNYERYGGKCLKKSFEAEDKCGNSVILYQDTDHLNSCKDFEEKNE